MQSPSYCANDFGPKLALKIFRGASFERVVQWMTDPTVYRPVASLVKRAPCTIKLGPGAALPDSWLVAIPELIEALGFPKFQPPPISQFYRGYYLPGSLDTIELPELDVSDVPSFQALTNVMFKTSFDWEDCDALVSIHADNDATSPEIDRFSSFNGRVTVDPENLRAVIHLTKSQANALTWKNGFFFMTVTTPSGAATRILQGPISVG